MYSDSGIASTGISAACFPLLREKKITWNNHQKCLEKVQQVRKLNYKQNMLAANKEWQGPSSVSLKESSEVTVV